MGRTSTTQQTLTNSKLSLNHCPDYILTSLISDLVQWLWPQLIQKELDKLREQFNSHVVRYDAKKKLPSGVSPNVAFALHTKYHAVDCLQKVDTGVVRSVMKDIGGEDLIRFISADYATRAEATYHELGLPPVTFQNVWTIFQTMLPHMIALS